MRNICVQMILIGIVMVLGGCEQRVSITGEDKLTGINPLSYTDVEFRGQRDTVLASTFDGKITQIMRGGNDEQLIIDLDDEIYDLAFNADDEVIYASTLGSGIVVIDAVRSKVIKELPLKEKWSKYVFYSDEHHLLMASDYGGHSYIWNVEEDYRLLNIPDEFSTMRPVSMNDRGHVYFDGTEKVGIWNVGSKMDLQVAELPGEVVDSDSRGNVLTLSYDVFRLYHFPADTVIMENKHPDWPIYVESRDTVFRAPVNLPLTGGIISEEFVLTSGIDRSIRKWNIDDGVLADELLSHRATISAMDLSDDGSQLVSVDLKGKIIFWEL